MRQYKKDIVETIRNNPQNAVFFKAANFHEDKGYSVFENDGQKIFAVKTKNGMAYYKLNGSIIGSYTELI
jgi:hypothetical protein